MAETKKMATSALQDGQDMNTGNPAPEADTSTSAVLKVKELSVGYATSAGEVHAVDDVSFSIQQGEVFALVGESGCGKSTTAMAIMRLLKDPGRVTHGSVISHDQDLLSLSEDEMASVRGHRIGMIFQNPLDSLNPVYTLGYQIAEGLMVDGIDKADAWKRAVSLLSDVRIPDATERARQYPIQVSGGMRQRVMIAMMLGREPELLIADEPTTALDVTTQAQILDLMRDLQHRRKMAMLLITHDFGIVAEMADRVGVMYAGKLVELAPVMEIFDHPRHPYTRMLMRALPTLGRHEGRLQTISGTVPSLINPPVGCRFCDRCPRATEACRTQTQDLVQVAEGHYVACERAVNQDD